MLPYQTRSSKIHGPHPFIASLKRRRTQLLRIFCCLVILAWCLLSVQGPRRVAEDEEAYPSSCGSDLKGMLPIFSNLKTKLLHMALEAMQTEGLTQVNLVEGLIKSKRPAPAAMPFVMSDSFNAEADISYSPPHKKGIGVVVELKDEYDEGFQKEVNLIYREKLGQLRPVLVHVERGRCCAMAPVIDGIHVPMVLVSAGYDNHGSPFHNFSKDQAPKCARTIIRDVKVAGWVVGQFATAFNMENFEGMDKLIHVPIGMGFKGKLRVGVPLETFYSTATSAFQKLKRGAHPSELVFASFDIHHEGTTGRRDVSNALEANFEGLVNQPYEATETVQCSLNAVFGASPRGTGFDCWRHYEFLSAGSVVLASDHPVLRHLLEKLPVVFISDWSLVTCRFLKEAALAVTELMDMYDFSRLTQRYWTIYAWQEVRNAGEGKRREYPPTTWGLTDRDICSRGGC
ncbi:unnamed protein product [Chrysoparadoxa australica]